MTWWLLIPAVLAYLAIGLGWARWSFVRDLKDSPRLQVDNCDKRFCDHKITMVAGKRHRPTKKYQDARRDAGQWFVAWPVLALLVAIAIPFVVAWETFNEVINRPTKAERQTQRQRELAALSTKAKELGLPVPAEWTHEA